MAAQWILYVAKPNSSIKMRRSKIVLTNNRQAKERNFGNDYIDLLKNQQNTVIIFGIYFIVELYRRKKRLCVKDDDVVEQQIPTQTIDRQMLFLAEYKGHNS